MTAALIGFFIVLVLVLVRLPIAFAMVRSKHATEGSTLIVNAEGTQASATVESLRFWTKEGANGA